ncbi:hypothetical protein MYBA111488_24195 [Mycobacterium basiliense]
MRLYVVKMWREFFGHDLKCLSGPRQRPYGASTGAQERQSTENVPPSVFEACYPIQRRSTKLRPNLPRSPYLVRVNWATLIKPRRNRSAHPVR